MHRLSCCLVLIAALTMTSVDAWFLSSVAGITSDIVKNPLESLSLFALKSYLLGHVNGRVTQYRQMAYNANQRQYQAQPPAADPVQYRQVQYAANPVEQYYNVRSRRSVAQDVIANVDTIKKFQDSMIDERAEFLEMADKLDNNKCIPRLVCEVMAGESITERGQFEDLVAKVFGDEAPESSGEQKVFSSVYHYAAFSGRKATGNGDHCRQLFPKCKASETEFRKMADKIFTGVDDDDNETADEVIEAISELQ